VTGGSGPPLLLLHGYPQTHAIPPEMDPNFFVQKGFKFFTMPWGSWAKAGIQNGLSGIKR
jgi:hypothetical protein